MAVRVYNYRRTLLTLCALSYVGIGLAFAFMASSPGLDRGFGWLPTGADAERAVQGMQAWAGLYPDGNVGDDTKRKITI